MRNVLSALGLVKKPATPKPIKQIKLHPACMSKHAHLVPYWLSGMQVEVLNPDGEWESCDNPIFSPEEEYRAVHAKYTPQYPPVAPRMPPPVPPAVALPIMPPQVAPVQAPAIAYARGDVFISDSGKTFTVLANKYELISNYNPANDPDSGPLVVVRSDSGIKPAVSCRNLDGTRADGNSDYALKTKVGTSLLTQVSICPEASELVLLRRTGMKDAYCSPTTGEVKLR